MASSLEDNELAVESDVSPLLILEEYIIRCSTYGSCDID